MKSFISCLLAGFLFSLLSSAVAVAQSVDSVLAIYADQYQQEKIHLHFDKPVYVPGDTIWFKAYIRAAIDESLFSKSFYADWYDENGKLLQHTVVPIFESSAKGQFAVPADLKGHAVQVKAYTKWMLNFDQAFIYSHEVPVLQPPTDNVAALKPSITTVHFFPEGGDLAIGLRSKIAFMATGRNGLPVRIKGVIRNSKKAFVDSLTTVHDGMGSFYIKPASGEVYTAFWKDDQGQQGEVILPEARNTGVVMSAAPPSGGNVTVIVSKAKVVPDNSRILYLIGTMNQNLVVKATLRGGTVDGIEQIKLPVATFPTGILVLTLLDSEKKPVAERIVFVNNHEYSFTPEVTKLLTYPGKRTKAVLEVNIPENVTGNLSVAVTDAVIVPDSSENIYSSLLLTGDLKGYIHHPAYYFSGTADSIARHLDLVMLTHGWRRFNWEQIGKGIMPALTYPKDTDFIQLKGEATGNSRNSNTGEKVMLMLLSKDSSRQMLDLPLQPDGSFLQGGVMFYDTIKVFYTFSAKNMNNRTGFDVNTGLLPALSTFTDTATGFSSGAMSDAMRLRTSKALEAKDPAMWSRGQLMMMNEVVVKGRTKRPVDVLDEQYASGLFTGDDGYRFDVINDLRAKSATDIFSYLQGMVPGLIVNNNSGQPTLTWRNASPQLYLNETVTDGSMISGLPVADVAYIKVFRPPFFGSTGNGAGGAIAIYTRKGSDVSTLPDNEGMKFIPLSGYTLYRQFYSPDYDQPLTSYNKDLRTTLYWNPFVLTDGKNHKAKLTFYKNDVTTKMRVIVEGMTSEGKMTHVEQVIE